MADSQKLSIVQALKMLHRDTKPEVSILGIEPKVIEFGLDLSKKVGASLPSVLKVGNKIIRQWMYERI